MAATLTAAGHRVELLPLVTTGDRWSASDASSTPDKGLFVKELEEALLDGRAHLAVHSAKDLPGELPPGLAVLAVPGREDARDVLVGPEGGWSPVEVEALVAAGATLFSLGGRTLRADAAPLVALTALLWEWKAL